jgi:hypothetical protein
MIVPGLPPRGLRGSTSARHYCEGRGARQAIESSARGKLETSIMNERYLDDGQLKAKALDRGTA